MNIGAKITEELNGGVPSSEIGRRYLKKLNELTGRNVIAYYSGWLQNPEAQQTDINDFDIYMLMVAVNDLEGNKGLDLILHTPGGEISAAEAIVAYLKRFFGDNIRAIVPQLALSAGTMIACSCKEIILGRHSSLGPIDPQLKRMPCQGVLEEFEKAKEDMSKNPQNILIWQPIISKYTPTLIGECEKAIDLSRNIVKKWLMKGMFLGETAEQTAENIVSALSSHDKYKVHDRHIFPEECRELGLKIYMMEENQQLQKAILEAHYAFMIGLSNPPQAKIVENHKGDGMMLPVNNSFRNK